MAQAPGFGKRFGDNIRKLRLKHGWSQDDLADASGLHRTYISGIERGIRNPTLSIIVQIAKALKVDPAALLSGGR